jgi:hypothetical protein
MTIRKSGDPAAKVVAASETQGDLIREGRPIADDPVGYRRPPKATRFLPGKSGNPKGRPKGGRAPGAILNDIFRQKITVTENGKARRVSALEAMLRRLRNDALRSDAGALKLLLSLFDRYGDSPDAAIKLEDILAEDRAILLQYMPQSDAGRARSSDPPIPEADDLTSKDPVGDDDDAA